MDRDVLSDLREQIMDGRLLAGSTDLGLSQPVQEKSTYPTQEDVLSKWLIYQEHAWCVSSMPAFLLERMVMERTTKTIQHELELHRIANYDEEEARWFVTTELWQKKRLTLYTTQQEAQQELARKSA